MKSNLEEGHDSSLSGQRKRFNVDQYQTYKVSATLMLMVVIVFTFVHLWIRWPALNLPYFHNEDTAGITYSADLILRGGLPLIDTVEMKAPGSFFVLAGWWSWVGRSIESAQLLGVVWSWMAMMGVMVGAWILYARKFTAIVAGGLYLYLAPFTDSIDINYGAWMITPYIWSAVLVSLAYQQTHKKTHQMDRSADSSKANTIFIDQAYLSWLSAGVLIACAALMKRQGAAIFPLACGLAYACGHRRRPSLLFLCGGVSLTFFLAFLPYMVSGHGFEAAGHYFFSKSGWSYLLSDLEQVKRSVTVSSVPARLPRLWDGVVGLGVHLPLVGLLASLNIVSQFLLRQVQVKPLHVAQYPPDSSQDVASTLPSIRDPLRGYVTTLLIFVGLSFVGAALGLRFFKGYYLQLIPGLIWLAVHPRGLPWAWRALIRLLAKRAYWSSYPIRNTLLVLTLIGGLATAPYATHTSWSHLKRARSMRTRVLYMPAWQIKRVSYALKRISDSAQTLDQKFSKTALMSSKTRSSKNQKKVWY